MKQATDTAHCYHVVAGLSNGDLLQGCLKSFSADDEQIELLPDNHDEPVPAKMHRVMAATSLLPRQLAYLGFLRRGRIPVLPKLQVLPKIIRVELLHGESFHIRTGDALKRKPGFYALPPAESSGIACYFFYHHAISARHSSEYVGKLLEAAGFVSPEAVQEALTIQQTQRERRLKEILQNNHKLSDSQLQKALREQQHVHRRLDEILLESGLIDQQDLSRALLEQANKNDKKIGQILIDMGAISELELASTLAEKYQLPLVNLDDYPIDSKAFNELDETLLQRYQWLPVASDEHSITVAIADPLDTEADTAIKFQSKKRIRQVIATPSQIRMHLERLSASVDEDDWLWLESLEPDEWEGENEEVVNISKAADAPPIVRIVNKIILDAYQLGASDIHLLPQADELTISYRINGDLIRKSGLEKWLQRRVISRLKLLANMDISENRLPQDGRLRAHRGDTCMDFRVSCMPCVYGESLVLRMLRNHTPTLTDIGLRQQDQQHIQRLLQHPFGLMLTTGPTGSGKSTTLQALVHELVARPLHIITAEDPVEADIRGVNQIQVNARIGLDFLRILRNVLRHDPDVVMIGEMRDQETARTGVEAALTGHLILSSLHTNSAVDTIARLIDLGIERYLLAPALLGIISQNLVKVLCPHCRQRAATDDETAAMLRDLLHMPLPKMYDQQGCEHCHQSGYSGRRMVYEILIVSDALRSAINAGEPADVLQRLAVNEGMVPKSDYALMLAASGDIDRHELLRMLV